MRAMVLEAPGRPLTLERRPRPEPGPGQVLVRVHACGVCRTDLHVVDGELAAAVLPIVPGHEAVGRVAATGAGVEGVAEGDRVGVPWLGHTCGACGYCRTGRENLCPDARFTGYQIDGGYADYLLVDRRYALPVHGACSDAEAAPLLCAGLIGHRALRKAGDPRRLGIYGFGAAAHIVAQVARWEGREVYAFVRPGDEAAAGFARALGAAWAGPSDGPAPEPLDAAIVFAPVGALVPAALRALAPRRPGGLRRHPHERHPVLPLRGPVAGTGDRLRRQPDPQGRGGIPGPRPAGACAHHDRALSPRTGRRGPRRSQGGTAARRGGAGDRRRRRLSPARLSGPGRRRL